MPLKNEMKSMKLPAIVVDEEMLLKQELTKVSNDIENAKKDIEIMIQDRDFLQSESQKSHSESLEYKSYMENKVENRHRTIISFNDSSQKEISRLELMQLNMAKEFESEKESLRLFLLEKENALNKAERDLADLQDYQHLKNEQTARIVELQSQIQGIQNLHSEHLQQVKAAFLREKLDIEQKASGKIEEESKEAHWAAVNYLENHTNIIKKENHDLRQKLRKIIQQSCHLQSERNRLLEQKRVLLRQQQLASELKNVQLVKNQHVSKLLNRREKTSDSVNSFSQQLY